ncbi:MAG: hypothetical protein NXI25_25750 [bacterium]|nr:hypothetical protein [bacterium]
MNTFFKQSNRTLWKLALLLVGAFFTMNSQAQVKHDFLAEQYNQLHWSPTQENFH